ncbi:hypothetical protein [Mycobacterium sp. NPDC004974]
MTLLLGAISQAQDRRVDALVFVGGLFDDRCVSPVSLTSLVQVLDAYSGQILIAPGADGEGIYSATNWGPRTFVWSSQELAAAPEPFGAVLGRARQPGSPAALPAEHDAGRARVLVDVGLDLADSMSWVSGYRNRHVITSGSASMPADGVTLLAPVNPGLGEQWGHAAVVTYDRSGVTSSEWVTLTTSPSAETIEIDVSAIATTQDLLAALNNSIATAPEWSVVTLVGELLQGVQLPVTAEYISPRGDVALRTDEVSFGFTSPAENDHTALAEFVRSLADADAGPQDRHQAIALGLAALVPSVGSVNNAI